MPDEDQQTRKRLTIRDYLLIVGLVGCAAAILLDIALGIKTGEGMNLDHLDKVLDGIIKLLSASDGGS